MELVDVERGEFIQGGHGDLVGNVSDFEHGFDGACSFVIMMLCDFDLNEFLISLDMIVINFEDLSEFNDRLGGFFEFVDIEIGHVQVTRDAIGLRDGADVNL